MRIDQLFSISFQSILNNKLRTSLTILGVVVGIFSIIVIMTIITMLQNSIEGGLSMLNKNTFQIEKFDRSQQTYTQLTDTRGYDAEGSYSPDGKLIAFALGDSNPERLVTVEDVSSNRDNQKDDINTLTLLADDVSGLVNASAW